MANTDSVDSRFNTRVLFEGGLRVLTVLVIVLLLLVSIDWLLKSDTYRVDQLQFEGSFERVAEADLERAVLPTVQGNYLMLDLKEIRQAAESLPWVKKAWVRRSWPDGIHIRFTEERPVAFWGADGSLGTDGQVIPEVEQATASSLPRLSGPRGTSKTVLAAFNKFQPLVQAMDEHIQALQLTSRRTWRMQLVSGTEIVVDQEQSEMKLARLASVYARIDGAPRKIDLRYTNGFAVDRRPVTKPTARGAHYVQER